MNRAWMWCSALVFSTLLAACGSAPGGTAPTAAESPLAAQSVTLPAPIDRRLSSAGSRTPQAVAPGGGALEYPELSPGIEAEPDLAGGARRSAPVAPGDTLGINRRLPGTRTGPGVSVDGGGGLGAQGISFFPRVKTSFDGPNLRDQRTANGGRQFSVEPPDQALCAGGGFVLASVNAVLRVYDSAGNPKTGVIDLNTFYGYPPAIVRGANPVFGPFITDPVCLYDAPTKRWFHVVLTIDRNPATGAFLGPNHLDIAVSQTPDPTGAWTIYRLPVQNDGSDGTPVHPNCPCLGDYPHIGADANGLYLSTNEFPLFRDGFNGVQIYAIDKLALAASDPNPRAQQFDLTGSAVPAFTVWPAVSPGQGNFERDAGGSQYFLSSQAVFADDGTSDQLAVWALSNTRSLRSGTPDLSLTAVQLKVNPYAVPGVIAQKPGDFPLGQCINDTTLPTPTGPGCWRNLFAEEPAHDEVLAPLDGNDSRMQQVVYANGQLWGVLDTAIAGSGGGPDRVGVAWYALRPNVSKRGVQARVQNQGYLSVGGNSLTRPAIALNDSGRGVIGATLAGPDHFPSAAYASVDARRGTSQVYVAAAGKGPQDGFSGYKAFGDPPRPRWGDYGAAFSDGKTLWVANEYIAQSCTLAQYASPPFGSCGATRVPLGNWGTRISAINVGD